MHFKQSLCYLNHHFSNLKRCECQFDIQYTLHILEGLITEQIIMLMNDKDIDLLIYIVTWYVPISPQIIWYLGGIFILNIFSDKLFIRIQILGIKCELFSVGFNRRFVVDFVRLCCDIMLTLVFCSLVISSHGFRVYLT